VWQNPMLVRIGDKCSGHLIYWLHARRYRDGMTLMQALKGNMGSSDGTTSRQMTN
jgi:hypothetical protein